MDQVIEPWLFEDYFSFREHVSLCHDLVLDARLRSLPGHMGIYNPPRDGSCGKLNHVLHCFIFVSYCAQ